MDFDMTIRLNNDVGTIRIVGKDLTAESYDELICVLARGGYALALPKKSQGVGTSAGIERLQPGVPVAESFTCPRCAARPTTRWTSRRATAGTATTGPARSAMPRTHSVATSTPPRPASASTPRRSIRPTPAS